MDMEKQKNSLSKNYTILERLSFIFADQRDIKYLNLVCYYHIVSLTI